MNENEDFLKDLDKLIELFKKFREKTMKENIPGFDQSFFQNFDLIVNNYDTIKHNLPKEYFNQIGTSLKKMIVDMIIQLQKELGEDIHEKNEVNKTILEIDELLKKPGLSNHDIDNLLDKRTNLHSKED